MSGPGCLGKTEKKIYFPHFEELSTGSPSYHVDVNKCIPDTKFNQNPKQTVEVKLLGLNETLNDTWTHYGAVFNMVQTCYEKTEQNFHTTLA